VNINDDEEVRAQFRAVREHDAQQKPDFRVLLDRISSHSRSTGRSRAAQLWILAIAAACVVLAVTFAARQPRPDDVVPADTRSMSPISEWRSPTQVFLQTPGLPLLSSPRLLSSVLDGVTHAALQRKGE
jgi:hypothetical protein